MTLNRRHFLASAAALSLGLVTSTASPDDQQAAAQPAATPAVEGFTTITYNCRHLEGWGAHKENAWRLEQARKQFPQRLALELALYNPGIVTLPEAPSEALAAELAQHLGMQHFLYAEGAPGAILARCPVFESVDRPGIAGGPCPEPLRGRYFARTAIETALGPVIVYSAHTTARNLERRTNEIHAMIEVMRPDIESGQSLILQGDLNHPADCGLYEAWKKAGLVDAFALKGTGVQGTHGTSKPFLRLDYIWLHGPIIDRLTECRVLYEGAFRTFADDPASFTFSDHLPLMARFE